MVRTVQSGDLFIEVSFLGGVEGARLEQLTIPNLQISVSFILCFTKQKNVECDGALEGKQGKSLREWRSAKTACLEMSIPAWKGKKKSMLTAVLGS